MAVEHFSSVPVEVDILQQPQDDITEDENEVKTQVMDPLQGSSPEITEEIGDWFQGEKHVIGGTSPDETDSLNHSINVDEKSDLSPENASKSSKSLGYIELEKALEKMDESKELDIIDIEYTRNPNSSAVANLREPMSPNAEEVSRFISDKSAYIEDVFKCMLRGISNSKLNIVKNNWGAPSSITELDDETKDLDDDSGDKEDGVIISESSCDTMPITPEMKIRQLIRNLDYFIDILCSIKSSDAKDTYSIIVLYEKLIFDIKSEISSLSKSLKIYQTIVGKEGSTSS